MPINILSISHTEAQKIVSTIIEKASSDGGAPVAIAVVDFAGRLIAFTAMDHVIPACIKLAQSKAYSAVIGKNDTINWASKPKSPDTIDFDMRNWTDPNFTGFTGGIVIKFGTEIIGAIGVSGRKGIQNERDSLLQDSELAQLGLAIIKF